MLGDFIEGAALLSDIFATCGMKIVLSGPDSLGFAFAEDEQLYDRCIMSHTTFIPYREFERVLGIEGIDEYVDSAIAKNIQHSLKNYQYAGHFRSLIELYDMDELTSVINRIVEDMNHRFTIEVLTRDFKSNDLRI